MSAIATDVAVRGLYANTFLRMFLTWLRVKQTAKYFQNIFADVSLFTCYHGLMQFR